MPKPLKAGGEVDSWCTKCKLVLNHRIIAMIGTKPVKVECSTCGSHHNYRGHAPGTAPSASPRERAAGASAGVTRTPRGPTRAEQDRVSREQSWEKAIAGKGVRDFRPYSVGLTFQSGDLVRHTKFGDGVVTRIVDAHKVEILFKEESKTLAQGLVD
jgi:hypothetical protein